MCENVVISRIRLDGGALSGEELSRRGLFSR